MKKFFATAAFILMAGFAAHAQQYSNPKIHLGQPAPDLTFNNPAGETVQLSKVAKGRVVLLDFWASWCGPCRRASPGLVSIYNDFKDKKFKGSKQPFTVVSVSLDQNKDAWMKAISDDGMVWPYHMSDLGAWQSKAAEIYGIQYIPQAFLINADGKIIGKYMLAEEARADIEKLSQK